MRSAVYHPSTQVRNRQVMQSSLLLWDELHTIVPDPRYEPEYGADREMAQAWELIGKKTVPTEAQKQRAHEAIVTSLESVRLRPDLYKVKEFDPPADAYEIWPQKFAAETLDLLRHNGLTDSPRANGDYALTQEGGLLVMAKLADACAGTTLARVTDRAMAYGMIGTGDLRESSPMDVIPVTLDIIDAGSIPIENLIEFRKKEAKDRNGRDFTKLRHAYANMVQKQIEDLGKALDQTERDRLTKEFRARMATDLDDLRSELKSNLMPLVLTPIVVATVAAGGAYLYGGTYDLQHLEAAASIGVAASAGSKVEDIAKTVAGFVKDRMGFSTKQRDILARHPMAYMWELSRSRP